MRMGRPLGIVVISIGALVGCQLSAKAPPAPPPNPRETPQISTGRYIVQIGGCNDCHTAGFAEQGNMIPEDQWLLGVGVGFKGPWGTTYASNLRLFVSKTPEDVFVKVLRARKARPPMSWESLHAMTDADLISVYRYIQTLPMKGDPIPEFVPAGVEPKTPYIVFEPVMPKVPGPAAANQPG